MDELKQVLMGRGATLVGYGDITAISPEVRENMPLGISIAVALNPKIVAGIQNGPTKEYYAEYGRVNSLLDGLAEATAKFLQERGHRAIPFAATHAGIDFATLSTRLPHKTVATRAGTGWIGKCALLVTEQFGSAVRLTTVLTDAELPVAEPVNSSRCGDCSECVDVCPVGAPSGEKWRPDITRDSFFNAFVCCQNATEATARIGFEGMICGMCIAACPWTKKYLARSAP